MSNMGIVLATDVAVDRVNGNVLLLRRIFESDMGISVCGSA
jgi:hypothetical protein